MKVIFRTLDGLEAIKEIYGNLRPERIILPCRHKQRPFKDYDNFDINAVQERSERRYHLTQEGQDNFVYVEKA